MVLLLVVLFAPVMLMPRPWLDSGIDMVFMSNLSSVEGGFSVSIPRRWLVQRGADHVTAFRHTPFDLSGQQLYALRVRNPNYRYRQAVLWETASPGRGERWEVSGRTGYRAAMYVGVTELPVGGIVSVEGLVAELSRQYEARPRIGRRRDLLDVRVELINLRGRQWSKTTAMPLPIPGMPRPSPGRISWQTINHTNLYVVTFYTDIFSYYGPVFDRIMESFTIRS